MLLDALAPGVARQFAGCKKSVIQMPVASLFAPLKKKG